MNKTNKKYKKKNHRSHKKRMQKGGNNDDESNCTFISSHGIIKAVQKLDNNIYYYRNITNDLNTFIIPNQPFVLVTGNEDGTIPDHYLDKTNEILNSPNLIHWYSQNLSKHDNPKLLGLPVGLDYHTVARGVTDLFGPKEFTPVQQEKLILDLNKDKFENRELKIYCNFKFSIRGVYGEKDRQDALDQIPKDLLIIEENLIPRNETWKNFTKYAFILSPHGNGLDCHRTWEALALGCIPVVKISPLDGLYDELPVLILKEWSDVNEQLLKDTVEEFKNKKFNMDKITLTYWMDKIKNLGLNDNQHTAIIKDAKQPKIFIIHYTPLEDRKKNILEQLQKYNLDAEFINMNKDDVLTNENTIKYNSSREILKKTAFLTKKHLHCYQEIIDKYDYALILEDDFILADNFTEQLNKFITELPDDWDMCFIGSCLDIHINSDIINANPNKHVFKVDSSKASTRCVHAYMVTKKCAKKVLNKINKPDYIIKEEIDHLLNTIITELNLNIYWTEPSIVSQGSENGTYSSSLSKYRGGNKIQKAGDKKGTIYIKLAGRLGNNLIEIFVAQKYAEKWNMNLIIIIEQDPYIIESVKDLKILMPNLVFEEKIPDLTNYNTINDINIYNKSENPNNDILLEGLFQDSLLVPEIPIEVKIPEPSPNLIKDKDAYFIHFRFGDFKGSKQYELPINYYKKAIKYFNKDSYFIIVSDEIDLAKEYISKNLSELTNLIYDIGGSRLDALYYISHSKGGICANSTFSWVGAYLMKEKGVICMPDPWWKDNINMNKMHPSWATLIKYDNLDGGKKNNMNKTIKKNNKFKIYMLTQKKGENVFEDYTNSIIYYLKKMNIDYEVIIFDKIDAKFFLDKPKNSYYLFHGALADIIPDKNIIKNIFIWNSEELTLPDRLRDNINNVNIGYKILDFSEANINILKKNMTIKHNTLFYLPYLVNYDEIQNVPKKNEMCIIGIASDARSEIFNYVNKKNIIKLNNIQGWGKERDNQLFQHKILLNVHYDNEYKIFETIRCARCIFNKMIIISNKSLDDSIPKEFKKYVIEYNTKEELVEILTNIASDFDNFYNNFWKDFDLKHIANIRLKYLKDIIKFLSISNHSGGRRKTRK